MKTEHLVVAMTSKQRRTLVALADELQFSVKETRAALGAALASTEVAVAQLAERRKKRRGA